MRIIQMDPDEERRFGIPLHPCNSVCDHITGATLNAVISVFSRTVFLVEARVEIVESTIKARRHVRLGIKDQRRSEEHTSELQSHHDLVCRLLLEKKKPTLSRLAFPSAIRSRMVLSFNGRQSAHLPAEQLSKTSSRASRRPNVKQKSQSCCSVTTTRCCNLVSSSLRPPHRSREWTRFS